MSYIKENVYVNALNGDVIKRISLDANHHCNCCPGEIQTMYNGYHYDITTRHRGFPNFNYRLIDNCRHIESGLSTGTPTDKNKFDELTDGDNVWTSISERPATSGHWAAERAFDYFNNVHLRPGMNGNFYDVGVIANYDFVSILGSSSNINAQWSDPFVRLGKGDGATAHHMVALDIVGHEWTHGVIQFTANLQTLQNEAGALSESYSDIFGEAIENYVTGQNDFLGGAQPFAYYGSNTIATKSLINPKDAFVLTKGPDTYESPLWYSLTDIHQRAGVQNKMFYLLSQGGSSTNDIGNQYCVDGIGLTKSAGIAYKALVYYLTSNGSNATFADSRAAWIQTARDYYGNTSNEVAQVTSAWYAVGVGSYTPPSFLYTTPGVNYNFGKNVTESTPDRIVQNISINNGNTISVNSNKQLGLLSQNWGFPTAPSLFAIQVGGNISCYEINPTITVNNGGQFVLGDNSVNNKANVFFKSGSTLRLRSGSTLIVNEGSKLVIEAGASIIIEPGAEIQLIGPNALIDVQEINTNINISTGQPVLITKTAAANKGGTIQFAGGNFSLSGTLINENCVIKIGKQMTFNYSAGASLQLKENNAVLDIAGTLKIGDGATFTFTYPNSPSGYVKFSSSSATTNIIAGTTSKVNLAGIDDNDVVLAGGYITPQDELTEFRVSPGTVSGAKIDLGCRYYFNHVRFNGGNVSVYGQSGGIDINNCIFDGAVVSGGLFTIPYRIIIYNSTFYNGGLFTAGGRVFLRNVNFNEGVGWQG